MQTESGIDSALRQTSVCSQLKGINIQRMPHANVVVEDSTVQPASILQKNVELCCPRVDKQETSVLFSGGIRGQVGLYQRPTNVETSNHL